jgi:hypothetical protein
VAAWPLVPDHKTVADFCKDNGPAIRKVCARFVELCRQIGLLATASVAIDGSKFKAVNRRDKNFTCAKAERRRAQLEESVETPWRFYTAKTKAVIHISLSSAFGAWLGPIRIVRIFPGALSWCRCH